MNSSPIKGLPRPFLTKH